MSLVQQYRAARSGSILVDRSDLGRLRIAGRDAADMLHRMTTNAVAGLRDGQGTATVFANPKGRVLDLVVLQRLADHFLCLTGPGRAEPVRAWIDRYTFREEIEVRDLSRSHGTIGIFGAGADDAVRRLLGAEAAAAPLHHPVTTTLDGVAVVVAHTFPIAGGGFHLTAAADDLPVLRRRLLAGGADLVESGPDCLEVLRIVEGLPVQGKELTEDYNPWEARLQGAISLDKGCYVGQEVIARLNTYNKVARQLVTLSIDGSDAPVPGAPLRAGEALSGVLTSAASVPGEDRVAGLGYLRNEDAVAGRALDVVADGRFIPATVGGLARGVAAEESR